MSLSGLFGFFKEDGNSISKGELKYKSGYVLHLKIDDYTIRGKVQASMKDKTYAVEIIVDGKGDIMSGNCECPRRKWLCSHMAAVAIYCNRVGVSKTDLPNSWIARPKKALRETQKFKKCEDFFPHPKGDYAATSSNFTKESGQKLFEKLQMCDNKCPMQWILGPDIELPTNQLNVLQLRNILN